MATATQPVQALIDLLFRNGTLAAPGAAPAANTAQQNAEPQDTVTIANGGPAGAQAAQVLVQTQVQIQEATVVAEFANPLQGNANPAGNANAAALNALLAPAAANGANAANNNALTVQQQELAQLDQVLEQLGIPPSSIPAVQQLALLLFRFDPQALLQFIHALQGVTQQIGNHAPANNGNNAAATAQQNNAAGGQDVAFAAQFQELQLTFTAVGVEPAGANLKAAAAAAGAGAGATAQGAALNVKA
jgi:hypothetical protein